MTRFASPPVGPPAKALRGMAELERRVQVGALALEGDLTLPERRRGLVVLAHGCGAARRSPRNRQFARVLQGRGFGTLLFDLLAPAETADRGKSFDIAMLSRRLDDAIDWLDHRPALASLPLAVLAAGTGSAAALAAAARRPGRIAAVVSRGGRPDLAGSLLPRVSAPTLLIVGSHDAHALAQNRLALAQLRAEAKLCVIGPSPDGLEEAGDVARAAETAARWFLAHLPAASRAGHA